jgi:phosphate:Na+ symporter
MPVLDTAVAADAKPVEAVEHLARHADELASLRLEHRRATLDAAASGKLMTSDAIAKVDAVRLLDRRAHHAWRAAAHLAGAVA